MQRGLRGPHLGNELAFPHGRRLPSRPRLLAALQPGSGRGLVPVESHERTLGCHPSSVDNRGRGEEGVGRDGRGGEEGRPHVGSNRGGAGCHSSGGPGSVRGKRRVKASSAAKRVTRRLVAFAPCRDRLPDPVAEVGLDEPVAEGHRRTRRWIVENYRLDHLRAYPSSGPWWPLPTPRPQPAPIIAMPTIGDRPRSARRTRRTRAATSSPGRGRASRSSPHSGQSAPCGTGWPVSFRNVSTGTSREIVGNRGQHRPDIGTDETDRGEKCLDRGLI